jgi:hypothetical protein
MDNLGEATKTAALVAGTVAIVGGAIYLDSLNDDDDCDDGDHYHHSRHQHERCD